MSPGPGRGRGAPPWIAFAICTLVWSSTFLFIRIGNDRVAPVWAATLRLALATVLLTLIAVATRQRWPRGAALRAALWFGFVDFGISLPLLYWGETSVPSGIASVLFATIPLSTAIFARIAGLEPFRPIKLAAALLALAGVAILFSAQMAGAVPPIALLAVFFGAVTASLAGVLLKRAPGTSPVATNAVAHAIGALGAGAVSMGLRESHALPASAQAWAPILYLTIVGSVVAFVSFAWLVERWPVTRISFISVIIPVVALALGVAVRGEHVTMTSVVGSIVVLGAVVLGIASDRAVASKS